jgi:uncharacterized protein YndB with AHSA1/START domain
MAEKYTQVGRVSSASVKKGTGKGWDEWVKVLRKAGATQWTHQEIVAYLKRKHRLIPWWQQGVTLGFEIATGRRVEGQNMKGEYSVTATKSLAAPAKKIWALLMSLEGQAAWLQPMSEMEFKKGAQFECEGEIFGQVRSVKPARKLRFTWQETDWRKASVAELGLVVRPGKKTILFITQSELPSVAVREALRERWKKGLAAVAELLDKLAP